MYQLSSLSNEDLLAAFAGLVAQDRRTTAALLAYIAEIDARHLYLRAGHDSMRSYCMAELGLSEDSAAKRIQVARLARQLPVLFPAIADGRLTLGAVRLLAPRLTAANVDSLIAESSHKTVAEIEYVIARHFPRAENLRLEEAPVGESEHATWHAQNDPTPVQAATERAPLPRAVIKPLSAERYTVQVSLPKSAHDKLREAQGLLAHAVPSGQVAVVIERALDALLVQLKKRRFAQVEHPRLPRETARPRTIPAHVLRAVYRRDGQRCTWEEDGRRCENTSLLELDHVVPVARGGRSTVANLRTLCQPHNRAAAEEVFGLERMRPHGVPRALR